MKILATGKKQFNDNIDKRILNDRVCLCFFFKMFFSMLQFVKVFPRDHAFDVVLGIDDAQVSQSQMTEYLPNSLDALLLCHADGSQHHEIAQNHVRLFLIFSQADGFDIFNA